MNFLSQEQIIAVVIFFVGILIMTLCAKYERKVDERLRDPKLKYTLLDGGNEDVVKQKNLVGNILSILGGAIALYGFVTFFLNIK